MSKLFKSKTFLIILASALFGGGAYLYFAWAGQGSLQSQQLKEYTQKYYSLQDSIGSLSYSLRQDIEPKIAQIQKDRIELFQTQISDLRVKISRINTQQSHLTPSSSSLDYFKTPMGQIILWVLVAISTLTGMLWIIAQRRKRNKGKIKLPKKPPVKDSSPEGNSSLEQLLDTLNANREAQAPIAQNPANQTLADRTPIAQARPKAPRAPQARVASPNLDQKPSQPQQSQEFQQPLNSIQEIPGSKIQPSQTPQLRPPVNSEEIFPSSLNRFDQEDKQKSDVIKLARRGYTSSEIARRLKLSQDQVEFIIRLQREKG